jgi:hypothetical protein
LSVAVELMVQKRIASPKPEPVSVASATRREQQSQT